MTREELEAMPTEEISFTEADIRALLETLSSSELRQLASFAPAEVAELLIRLADRKGDSTT